MSEIDQFVQMVKNSDNIVFSAEPVFRQKAAYPIFAV